MSVLQGSGYPATVTPASGATTGFTAVLTVTAPDGTTTTPTVTTTATAFTATVPATLVGNYTLVWALTGTPNDVIVDQFTAVAAGLTLTNLANVKQVINKANDNTKDALLRAWLREATTVIENITGPILPVTKTYTVDGGGTFFVLPDRWVKSITSVTETLGAVNYVLTEQPLGSTVDAFGYTWDRSINKIVRRIYGGAEAHFPAGTGVVTCVYVAGMTTIPAAIERAAAQLVGHWWNKDQQPYRSAFNQNNPDVVTMVGNYEVPNSVMEVLENYRRTFGIF